MVNVVQLFTCIDFQMAVHPNSLSQSEKEIMDEGGDGEDHNHLNADCQDEAPSEPRPDFAVLDPRRESRLTASRYSNCLPGLPRP